MPMPAVEENPKKFHFLNEIPLVQNKAEKSWFPFEIFIRNFAELVRSKKPILHDLRPVYELCMVCGRQYDYMKGSKFKISVGFCQMQLDIEYLNFNHRKSKSWNGQSGGATFDADYWTEAE